MHIANPIYDTVFKFLMEDTESAILLLSAIINKPIASLEFLPQENIQQLHERSLTVYRLDFAAKIQTDKGFKQVLIEIQKAKLPSDIMRFRRYLGEQYSKKSNVYTIINDNKQKQQKPLPILSIYFLGYALANINTPVIHVNRQYYDVVHQQKLDCKEEFIESLTHDSYVIQISKLKEPHQTEIEQLLTIFDQHKHLATDEHILEINENQYPKKYRSLVRRLQQAILEPEIRKTMDAEDEILADLQHLERQIEQKDEALQQKDQEIEQNRQALQQKDQELDAIKQQLALLQQHLPKDST